MERGLHSFLRSLVATSGKLRGEFGGGESGANDDQATRLWALLLTKSSGHETKVLYFFLRLPAKFICRETLASKNSARVVHQSTNGIYLLFSYVVIAWQ
jgi:hypothetical protein